MTDVFSKPTAVRLELDFTFGADDHSLRTRPPERRPSPPSSSSLFLPALAQEFDGDMNGDPCYLMAARVHDGFLARFLSTTCKYESTS
jgi:hypothetical protein